MLDYLTECYSALTPAAQTALLQALQADPILCAVPLKGPYLGRLLKQLIVTAEDDGHELLDEIVELYTQLLTESKVRTNAVFLVYAQAFMAISSSIP